MKPLRAFLRTYRLVLAAVLFGAMLFLLALSLCMPLSGPVVMSVVLGVLTCSVLTDVFGGNS